VNAVNSVRVFVLFAVLVVLVPEHSQGVVLDQDDVVLAETIGSNSICFHRNTACVDSLKPLILDRLRRSVREIGCFIAFENVEIRVMVFPERTLPSKGMSGAAPNAEQIYILLDPDHPRLATSLSEEMVATLAHEYHHTSRKRTARFSSNLFEAIVSEGLAEHFVMEVTGAPPPWAEPVDEDLFAHWRVEAEKDWFNPEYDYLAWFIGLNSDIPRGTGYEIGRRLIGEYLDAHPGERASALYGAPAEVFLPRE